MGSVNDGKLDKQPDMDSCRILCQSYIAKYFTWRGPTSGDASSHFTCWCKNELREDYRKNAKGVFTGDTECNGEL